MFSSSTCRFVIFSFLSLSANAETLRGVHRELTETVSLGDAGAFVILAKTGITTVPDSVITGDIAVSPITGDSMTGFEFTADSSNTFKTAPQISGSAYAADYTEPTPTTLTTAVNAMETAYANAKGRTAAVGDKLNIAGGILNEVTLTPGVSTFGTDVHLTGHIYFDGTSTDIFIIQITGNLIQDASKNVSLLGGALAKNIFWQVAGHVEVGAHAHMEGTILAMTAVTFITESSLNGRVFTQTACNLQKATIAQSA
jgi:hypothetical protein